MNREIKFRTYNKGTGLMSYNGAYKKGVWLSIASNGKLIAVTDDRNIGWTEIEAPEIELMQFTGLLDKSGKEIYEGDIIINDAYSNMRDDGSHKCRIVEFMYASWQPFDEQNRDGYAASEWEVIGNIYENPELLN
jgi:uncharacterized phage protein (TIGR01671 family)